MTHAWVNGVKICAGIILEEQQIEKETSVRPVDPALSKKLLDALQEIARAQFKRQRQDHTLQPTALVNELWLKILRSETAPPSEIQAFRAWAATAIRNILISHARAKGAAKRGGSIVHVELKPSHKSTGDSAFDLLELEEELQLLKRIDERAARVVELRFFGGMDHAQIATELNISPRLSQRTWAMARSWLSMRMQDR
ncbi:MAG: sigma-70 family RNA polymerase sigma factor [Planctomycetes bacterium]|nr:sigma-70 family RNA polymerase sigma factor [Planctomycetota bacterium]